MVSRDERGATGVLASGLAVRLDRTRPEAYGTALAINGDPLAEAFAREVRPA